MSARTQTLYKLTDRNGQTCGGMQWGENITHVAKGKPDQDLCTNGWIHAYEHPLLAVFLNPTHADFQDPQLWEACGVIRKREGQLKCGCRKLTTIQRLDLPQVTTEQKIRFAIACAAQVCKDERWLDWANRWLSGLDRSEEAAAWAAAEAAWAAAEARAAARAWIDLIRCAEWAINTSTDLTEVNQCH